MIAALFPQLNGPGGVQRLGRAMVDALRHESERTGDALLVASLLGEDHPEAICFAGSRARMALWLMKHAARIELLWIAHPYLAPLRFLLPHTPCVVHAHGIEVWKPLSRIRRAALRSASVVTASSEHTAEMCRIVQHRQKPIEILHPPVEECAIDPTPPGDDFLTISRLGPEDTDKGVPLLIDLYSRQDSVHLPLLHVVGDGPSRAELERRAERNCPPGKVVFHGRVTEKALGELYERCRALVLPSLKEGFGIVYMEAAAKGRPSIGFAAGGVTDAVINGRTGMLVPPGDAEALFASMQCLAADKGLATQLGVAAHQRAVESFQQTHFRERVASILAACR